MVELHTPMIFLLLVGISVMLICNQSFPKTNMSTCDQVHGNLFSVRQAVEHSCM